MIRLLGRLDYSGPVRGRDTAALAHLAGRFQLNADRLAERPDARPEVDYFNVGKRLLHGTKIGQPVPQCKRKMSHDSQGGQGHLVTMKKRGKTDPSARPAMCVRMRQIRDVTGFTGKQMAAVLKVEGGQPTYKTYEIRTRPTREVMGMVERRLGVPAKALLDTGGVTDEEFNAFLDDLRARMPKIRQIFNEISTERFYIPSDGDDPRIPVEGELGQETAEVLFKMLRQLNAKIDQNTQAIHELMEGKKPGFPKGRR